MSNNQVIMYSLYGRDDSALAGGTITPGHLIQLQSAGTVVVHATEGGRGRVTIAKENSLQGSNKDDNYTSGDRVFFRELVKGDTFYGFLAAGESITPATQLMSAGDGTFKAVTGSYVPLVTSEETKDNSASGAVAVRVKFRVL